MNNFIISYTFKVCICSNSIMKRVKKDHIIIKGARQHNLQNINTKIPRNTLTVITGLSGSGKSSLAFDTIYAEGQRRSIPSGHIRRRRKREGENVKEYGHTKIKVPPKFNWGEIKNPN